MRGATVQLLSSGGTTLASTITDTAGNYSFSLPTAQAVMVRVRAELKDSSADFTVRDNTQGGAMYAMDSAIFTPSASATTIDLAAPSGWGGSSYTGTRVAGPFAILDVAYKAKQKVLSVSPTTVLEPLKLYWSVNNVPSGGSLSAGQIGTSFFTTDNTGSAVLYLLGAANVDTDEYDQPVVAHEIGHFLQHAVSRDDSVGGPHTGSDKLDMRVAFSEGWGNSWAGMALGSPIYHDSRNTSQASGFAYNVSTMPSVANRGWYNESTVEYLLYQAHQDAAAGFSGIYDTLVALRTSPAATSIHNFNTVLKQLRPAAASSVNARSTSVGVNSTDIFGSGESNNGGLADALPVYKTHSAALGTSQQYCVSAPFGTPNKLGNYVYVRFTASGSRSFSVTRTGTTPTGTDPDVLLIDAAGARVSSESATADSETFNATLPNGSHVIIINDFNLSAPGATHCFNLRID